MALNRSKIREFFKRNMWPCIGALVFVIFYIGSSVVYDFIGPHAKMDAALKAWMMFANRIGFPLLREIPPALIVMWAIYCGYKKGVIDYFWVIFFGIVSSEVFRVAFNAILHTRVQGFPAKMIVISFIPTAVLILCGGVLCWAVSRNRTNETTQELWTKNRKTAISVTACVGGALVLVAVALLLFSVSGRFWRAELSDLLRYTLPGLLVLVLALCVQRQGGHILWILVGYAAAAVTVYWLLSWGGGLIEGRQMAENAALIKAGFTPMASAGDLAGKWQMVHMEHSTGAVLAAIGTLAFLRGRPISAAWSVVLVLVAAFTVPVTLLIAGEKGTAWLFVFVQRAPYIFPILATLPQCVPKSALARLTKSRQ